jgi:hypothetical protein
MEEEQVVSIQQMKDAVQLEAGSKFPLKITRTDGEVIVRYIRGFADQQRNILLVSENSYSLAMKILEVKDIRTLEYAPENTGRTWRILQARWLTKHPKV